MPDGLVDEREAHRFSAVLMPPHALPQKGFAILMWLFGGVSAIAGIAFSILGAWPVVGFFGLDVLLVYLAFAAYRRAARAREIIELTADALLVNKVARNGTRSSFSFNPRWVRLEKREFPDGSNELALASHGRRLVIASFLGAAERREFAGALRAALAVHRA